MIWEIDSTLSLAQKLSYSRILVALASLAYQFLRSSWEKVKLSGNNVNLTKHSETSCAKLG